MKARACSNKLASMVVSDHTQVLIRSKQRVADHGEVFTPAWLVEDMLNLVKEETERIDSRFLEPACGSGNFLVPVLRRKLATVEIKYGRSDFDKKMFALFGLMCIYGIELLEDNIAECRANLLEIFCEYLNLGDQDDLYLAATYVTKLNLVHGDAMKMKDADGQPILFAEWGYIGKGKFQRRDFRLAALTQAATFSKRSNATETGSLWADSGKDEIFQPERTFRPMTVQDMAKLEQGQADIPTSPQEEN